MRPKLILTILSSILFLHTFVFGQSWEITQRSNGEFHIDRNVRLLSIKDSVLWVSSADYIGNVESPLMAMHRLTNRWAIPIDKIVSIQEYHLKRQNLPATGAFLGFIAAMPISAAFSHGNTGTNLGLGGLINDVFYRNFLVFLVTTPIGAWLGHQAELKQSESVHYDFKKLTRPEKVEQIQKILEEG